MEFTTRKILNNGRLIVSTISQFFIAITCLIIHYFNANIAKKTLQDSSEITSSKLESSSSSATATTIVATNKLQNSPKITSSKLESSSSATAAATTTTTITTTTKTPSVFSSIFDSTPYSSPWMYSTSGDLIGTESGVFMASTREEEDEILQKRHDTKSKDNVATKKQPKQKSKKEYPPIIPSWRCKIPGPWSLSRQYIDGRLILKEQGMEYYEYLESKREKGCLMLNLLVLKGNIQCQNQQDLDDTMDGQITNDHIDQGEKKKMIIKSEKVPHECSTIPNIQEEIQKDFVMMNGEENSINKVTSLSNEDGMTSSSSMLVVA